ncbi:MAG TPA: DUF2269 domain-containing protein [Acidimicrobiia bacterium]|nr:DUF2269 domain-containing protein [Acidimicrobiia bacterium]
MGYLGLGITAVRSASVLTVRSAWIGMETIGWFVIVPLAIASLITGVLISLGTRWGLFRHYWVLISFALTLSSAIILILHMPTVTTLAEAAQTADGAALRALGGDLAHPSIGLAILLCVQVLNVFKPRGLTRYGWRRQQEAASR